MLIAPGNATEKNSRLIDINTSLDSNASSTTSLTSEVKKCPICLEEDEINKFMKGNCNHEFCTVCIEKWMNNQSSCACPICRGTIYEIEFSSTLMKIMNSADEQFNTIKMTYGSLFDERPMQNIIRLKAMMANYTFLSEDEQGVVKRWNNTNWFENRSKATKQERQTIDNLKNHIRTTDETNKKLKKEVEQAKLVNISSSNDDNDDSADSNWSKYVL